MSKRQWGNDIQIGTDPGLRKNSTWMLSGQGFGLIFQAIYFVLLGRTLSSRDYGLFVGVAAMIQVLSNFSSLGMEMVMVRDVSHDKSSFATAWGSALFVTSGGFVVVLAIAMTVGRLFFPPDVMLLVPFVAFSDAFCGKLAVLAGRAFQGFSMLAYTAKLTAANNMARAATAGILFLYVHHFHTHPSAYTWTRIYWIGSLIVGSISVFVVTARLGLPKFRRISLHELSEGFSFSLSSSSISVYNDIDKTFLVSLGQLRAAGIYSAAYRLVDVATTPIYSIYMAAFPKFFQEGAKSVRSAANLSRKLMSRTTLYGAAVGVAMFAGASLLPHVLGQSFAESSNALRWLCFLPLIRSFHYAWGTAVTGSSSQWLRTGTQVGAALLNVLLNALLIPRWSWRGAAVASLATDGALAVFSWALLSLLLAKEKRKNEGMLMN